MKKNILFATISSLLIAAILFFACSKGGYSSNSGGGSGGGTGGGGGTTSNIIYMKGSAFSNPSLTVVTGTTVTWMNDDNMTHTVTSDNGVFNSGNMAPGSSYSYTFSAAGTFNYHCIIHSGMTGSVTVSGM